MAEGNGIRSIRWLRRNLRPIAALGALAVLSWAASGWFYLSRSGGASAEDGGSYRDFSTTLLVPSGDQWYTVQFQFLMEDGGTGDFAAQAAAARAEMVARFPGAIEQKPGEMVAQFVSNGYLWTQHTAAWSYNAVGKPSGLTGELAALNAAANSWTAAGASFTYTGGGTGSGNTGACSGSGLDGANTLGWAPQSGAVLAVTCTWYGQSSNPGNAIEFDMQIDPGWDWTTGSSINIDLQSVILHELGHALGLGHSADSSAVMFASYCQGCNKRALAPDDIAGITSLYGAGSPNPPAATPTPANTPPAQPSATATAGAPTKTPSATPSPRATASPPSGAGSPTATPRPSLPLLPGVNLLTWPNADGAPAAALANQGNAIAAVYGYDPATKSWKHYFPGAPAYVNSLPLLQQGQAYWFVAANGGAISIGN